MRKKNLLIIAIIIFSFILRVVNLNQSFWLDEAAQVIESSRPLSQQFRIISDFHPPFYHLVLHFWMYFGHSEIWVRLLSVLLGTGCIYLVYKIGQYFGKEKVGLLSALFLALSPYHIWYSQEARPYMLFVFLSLLSTFFLLQKKWILYSFAVVLCLYSLYFAPFLFLGHLIYVFLFEKKCFRNILLSFFIGVICFFPWLPSFIKQLERGTGGIFSGWTSIVSVAPIKAIPLTFAKFIFGKGTIDNLLLYGLVVIPMFLIFLLSIWESYRKREGTKILILFFIFFFTSILISFIIPIIAPQRLIFLLPFFLLSIAYGIFQIKKIWRVTAIVVVMFTSTAGLFDYYTNPYVQREQWRQAISYVEENDTVDKTIAIFVFPEPFAPYLWYEKGKIEAIGIAPRFRLETDDLDKLSEILVGKEKIYLFQYLTGLTDPTDLAKKYFESLGYKLSNTKDFPGVGFIFEYNLCSNKNSIQN